MRKQRRLGAATVMGVLLGGVGVVNAAAAPGAARPAGPIGGHPMFTVQSWGARAANPGAAAAATTVPTWSGSFVYSATTYHYSMVGTNPASGSATTTVPAEIVPIKVVMANGIITTGSASALTSSPIFKNTAFTSGTTQLADAMQRSSFWSSVSTVAPNYHLLLGTPTVLSTVTIKVPSADGSGYTYNGIKYAYINYSWWTTALKNVITAHKFSATTLPFLVTGNTFLYLNNNQNDCCIYGYHGDYTSTSGTNTYIFSNWLSAGLVANGNRDVYTMSHEVSEWAADPFVNNSVRYWNQPNGGSCYSNLLEVGDPVEALPTPWYTIKIGTAAFHPSDIAGISWFSHGSSQQNGLDSYKGFLKTPATYC